MVQQECCHTAASAYGAVNGSCHDVIYILLLACDATRRDAICVCVPQLPSQQKLLGAGGTDGSCAGDSLTP